MCMIKILSDEAIIIRIQKGDKEMFAKIVSRYKDRLLNHINRIIRSVDDAEDLLQDMFIKIFNGLNGFDSLRKFKPWAYRIATNVCYDYIKKKPNNVPLDKPLASDNGNDSGTLLDYIGDESSQPEKEFLHKQMIESVWSEVRDLPLKHKEVFLLFHYEKFSYEEIAESLSIPMGTVKSRLHNACKKIFVNLEKENA